MSFSKKYFFSLLWITIVFFANKLIAQAEVECNIVFPIKYKSQGIKIYQAGEILHTAIQENILSFFVKDHKREQTIYFVIVRPSDVMYKFKSATDKIKQQTIDSIHIVPDSFYKSYKVTVAKNNEDWAITECWFDEGVIPDMSVLISYNPEYISNCTIEENKLVKFHVIENLIENGQDKDCLFIEELMYVFDTLHADPLYQKSSYRVVNRNSKCKQVIHV